MGESRYFVELCDIIEAMEEKNYGTIRTEMIESLRAENKALKDENAELSQKVEWLMEQLRLLKKKQFGASSEQTKGQLDGQLSLLFNESVAYLPRWSRTRPRPPKWLPTPGSSPAA